MIYIIATNRVKPEAREAYIKGSKEVVTATQKEKGCVYYENHVSLLDPNLFVVVERWETQEDLDAHSKAPHLKAWREYSAPLKATPTEVEIITNGKVLKLTL
jgi:quinol monooxygenase YgiN